MGKRCCLYAIAMSLALASCTRKMDVPGIPQSAGRHPVETVSRFIGRETGGVLSLSNGTGVVIPPNTLSKSSTITIEQLRRYDAPPTDTGFVPAGYVYQFDSGQASFTGLVTIVIHYRDSDVPAGNSEDDLRVITYGEGNWHAVPAESNSAQDEMTAATDHFSPWSLAVEVPSPTPAATPIPSPTRTPIPAWTPEDTATITPTGTCFNVMPVATRTPTPVPGMYTPTGTPVDTPTVTPAVNNVSTPFITVNP